MGRFRKYGIGWSKDGYNKFTKTKYNIVGFDRDGYDRRGWSKDGYDRDGYDRDGWSKDGYNRDGYDKKGFDRDGYNKDTKSQYDKDGWSKGGYNELTKTKFDRDGYDREGYDRDGYDIEGYDRDGYDKGLSCTSQNALSLKVQEAYDEDIEKGVVRIDYDSMKALSASTGDVIGIKGKRRTVAKCLALYPPDEGKGIIRVDGLVRNNSGIAVGDTISVRKIKAVAAEKIIVAPLKAIPPIDEGYLADALENLPLTKGDNVIVPYFVSRLTFQVTGVAPRADAVIVTQKTVFHIAKK